MPFTISHAAAALPLRRLTRDKLPLAALMIGAMSPDFAYFTSFAPERMATHDLAGVFWFCWPAALCVWLLFVRVLEQPTVALLPEPWRARFVRKPEQISLRALALASVAVVLGAISHIIWDSFTHWNSPVVAALPFLHSKVLDVGGSPVRLFWLLQHLSSVFGAAVLIRWAWKAPPATLSSSVGSLRYATPVTNPMRVGAALALLVTTCAVAINGYLDQPDVSFEMRLFFFAIGGMKGFAIAWTMIAVFIDRYLRTAHVAPARIALFGRSAPPTY